MAKNKKIPFKISARTARLIGRQNFPNSEGAIIELVKNSYDADASVCILVFENRFSHIPERLTLTEYEVFSKEQSLISKYYSLDELRHEYILKDKKPKDGNETEKIKTEKGAPTLWYSFLLN